MSFEKIFRNPPKYQSPFPFWFLNDELKEEDITWALREFIDKNIYTVVLHPRTGLEVEYLTEEFWEKMGYIIEKCDEFGVKVFIYDEYNWPSGPMGGKLLREHPEYRQKFLDYEIFKEKKVEYRIEGEFLVAFEINKKTQEANNINPKIENNVLTWERPEKGWELIIFIKKLVDDLLFCTVCAPFTKAERGYIDLLNPEAVSYFIENTHEEYKKRFSEYFGDTIVGLFTDEPGNYAGWMWTDGLIDKIKDETGIDLKSKLYQLVYNIGDDYLETRYNYYQYISCLYTNSYFKQVGDWCRKNNIKFTGHLVLEEDIVNLSRVHSSLYLPLKEMQMPGIDYLSDLTGYDIKGNMFLYAPNFAPKMISSLTHHLGLDQNLCEIFGGCGWDTNLQRLKRVIAWIQCCGVNGINYHASHLSLKGLRKRDFPASHFVQEPWWKYYHKLSDFSARLSYFNTVGRHVANFCILFPRTALNLNFNIYKKSRIFKKIATEFPKIGDILLRIQCDYDYIFEEEILNKKIRINKRNLEIREERYKVIVIPPIDIIPIEIYEFLAQFFKSGGTIIFIGLIPKHSEKRISDKKISEINKIFFSEKYSDKFDIKSEFLNQNENDGKIIYIPMKYIKNREMGERKFINIINQYQIERDIIIKNNHRDFIYQHRKIEDIDYYLITNLSNQQIKTRIEISCEGYITVYYPSSGDIHALRENQSKSRIIEDMNFQPNQCIIFEIRKKPEDKYTLLPKPRKVSNLLPIFLKKDWLIEPKDDGIFLFDNWKCKVLEKRSQSKEEIKREKKIWANTSLRVKVLTTIFKPILWLFKSRKVQNSRYMAFDALENFAPLLQSVFGIHPNEDFAGFYELMDLMGVFTKKIGFELKNFEAGEVIELKKNFKIEYLPSKISLVYEDIGTPISFRINDKELTYEDLNKHSNKIFVWDKSNREVFVKKYLKKGKNSLKVRIKLPEFPDLLPSFHGIDLIILKGEFSTVKNKIVEPVKVNKQTNWEKSGYKNYSGAMLYKNFFYIPEKYLHKKLILMFLKVKETVEVKINGHNIGEKLWEPFEYDISEYVKEGNNTIEVEVRNTAENFFGRPVKSGILDNVIIVPYEKK
ncbi:MAG: hypothetical protein GF329_14155 [Candidatus Lokiarchaeota archaeon]|nr:hypothetical protein [Candidatus Lokiarchaeota archaeon]